MEYTIKGNYFHNEFHTSSTRGLHGTDNVIIKHSPADLDLMLWKCPVDYSPLEEVVNSADLGFKTWRRTSLSDRVAALNRFKEVATRRKEEIAKSISLETGKPYWEALGEAGALAAKVDVTINESFKRIENKNYSDILPNTDGLVAFKPIGPCFIIGPFNFPCHLANGQILSALLAGNSIIFKPSEKTAYSGQLLFECLVEAGFPEGVLNLIQGDGETASRLLKYKKIKGVFFTGSKEVGQKILASTHQDLSKLVALELGGKNSAIVHSDANLNLALSELIKGSYFTTGQRCTSIGVTLVHNSLVEQFVDQFHQLAKKIIVDHPLAEKSPFMGPLIDHKALESYLLFMGMAKRENIEEVMRGKSISKQQQGYYVTPSIHFSKKFDHNSHYLSSEIFGPNVCIIPYTDIEEAIEISNYSEYGLAGCVFTKDQKVFDQCQFDLDVGLLNLNKSTVGASSKLPFGGVKNSGNYRPAAVTTIDACVYQMAGLKAEATGDESLLKGIVGIED